MVKCLKITESHILVIGKSGKVLFKVSNSIHNAIELLKLINR